MKILCTAQMGTGTVMGQAMRVVAIATALRRRGHQVRFVAGDKLIPIIKGFGIDVIEIADMPHQDYPLGSQLDDPRQREELIARMQLVREKIIAIETEAAGREKPDLLLCGTITGPKVGQRLGIPSLLTFLQPHGPKTLAMFTERLKDSRIRDALAESLAAADLIILEGMPEISGGARLEDLGGKAADLGGKIHFTGPLLTEYPDGMPSREMLKAKHCGSGDKTLVYITIGGGSQLIGEQFLQVVLEALRMLPLVAGVVATGVAIAPEKISVLSPPVNTLVRGFVPGTELVRASDVTVFHGGSSTLMTCLACGTPAVVVPSMGEHEDNGAVLADSGAGIVLDKQTLTAPVLAEAIRRILGDPAYRRQAARLKGLGEKYGGAEAAASLAEKIVAREAVVR
jgi:UDP:flavonoid glycosyltransferase YjiC (YdhE family)